MKKTNPPSFTNAKTLIVSADDKGGVTKSSSSGAFIDAIRQYGYSVATFDGDATNKTLSKMDQSAVRVDISTTEALDALLPSFSSLPEDLVYLDTPGSSGKNLAAYFKKHGQTLREHGLRVIIALTVVNSSDMMDGLKAWILEFTGEVEFIVLANSRDSKEKFDLGAFKGGQALLEMSLGRIITIPKFEPSQQIQFNTAKGVPTDYFEGGRLAQKLKLNYLQSHAWKRFLRDVMQSAEPYLEEIIGKPFPIDPQEIWSGVGPTSPTSQTSQTTKVEAAIASWLELSSEE
jgi:lambda repressor-like predicted transcriptional regulator